MLSIFPHRCGRFLSLVLCLLPGVDGVGGHRTQDAHICGLHGRVTVQSANGLFEPFGLWCISRLECTTTPYGSPTRGEVTKVCLRTRVRVTVYHQPPFYGPVISRVSRRQTDFIVYYKAYVPPHVQCRSTSPACLSLVFPGDPRTTSPQAGYGT
ncbi:hypothetical protein F4780DRAFT_630253 [Xylariomycetidae sp. FL0641]|nr:hypothetical protein F4780DRAFT_630253 [Xylariomycetidae sp. FL0641]